MLKQTTPFYKTRITTNVHKFVYQKTRTAKAMDVKKQIERRMTISSFSSPIVYFALISAAAYTDISQIQLPYLQSFLYQSLVLQTVEK